MKPTGRAASLCVAWLLASAGVATPAWATNVSGRITTDTTWTLSGSPYVVVSSVTVEGSPTSAPTLTIEAGVEVRVAQGQWVAIAFGANRGALRALGTADAPIRFTSQQPAGAKTRGFWYGVILRPATDSSTLLDHVIIEYAGFNGHASAHIDGCAPTLRHVTLREASGRNLDVMGSAAPTFDSLTVTGTGGSQAASLPAGATVTSIGMHGFDKPIGLQGGTIAADTVWRNLGAPYVAATITVAKDAASAATLTIEPGVEVRFGQHIPLSIGAPNGNKGKLVAQGTAEAPIVFTSSQDASARTRGFWNGIVFHPGADPGSVLDHVRVEYAGSGGGGLQANGAAPTIRNTLVRESGVAGLRSTGTAAPSLQSVTFENQTGPALLLDGGGATLENVTVRGTSGAYAASMAPDAAIVPAGAVAFDKPIELKAGTVARDVTWRSLGSPYVVTGPISVYKDTATPATLTIEPGVEVRVGAQNAFSVGRSGGQEKGRITALGTAAAPIVFTSHQPAGGKTRGFWSGLSFYAGADGGSVLDHVTVEYAGFFGAPGVLVQGSAPTFNHPTIRESGAQGLRIAMAGSPYLKSATIENSGGIAVQVDNGGGISIDSLVIAGTGGAYSMSLPADAPVLAVGAHTFDKPVELRTGRVARDTAWRRLGAPYVVSGSISVFQEGGATATLAIEPGVEVRFGATLGLVVGAGPNARGRLLAQGTAAEPIVFTSHEPAGATTRGFWAGLTFHGRADSASLLEHARVTYAGQQGAVVVHGVLTVRHSTLGESGTVGLRLRDGGDVDLQSVTIRDNDGAGIDAGRGALRLDRVTVTGTGGPYAMSLPGELTVETVGGLSFDKPIELRTARIAAATTWRNLGAPYVSTGNISVSKDAVTAAVLTVEPGVEVRFRNSPGLVVGDGARGRLLAQGTAAAPIVFTSDQPPAARTPGFWGGIWFHTGTDPATLIEHAHIEYAGLNSWGNVVVFDSQPTLRNTVIRQSSSFGISVRGTGRPMLQANNFSGNQGFALVNEGSAFVDARSSWWNDPGGPVLEGNGDAGRISGKVLFSPWLEAAQNPVYFANLSALSKAMFNRATEETVLSTTLNAPGAWTLQFSKDQTVVKTYSGTGAAVSQAWNGESDGPEVPDGSYRYRLTSTEGDMTMAPLVGRLFVSSGNGVAAEITSPHAETMLRGGDAIALAGTAAAPAAFESYRLEYGVGATPSSWSAITGNVTTPVVESFFGTWTVPAFDSGVYTLRLTVRAGGQTAVATRTVRVMNTHTLGLSRRHFSPNGDGIADTVTWTARTTYPARWTLTLKDSAGAAVRTFNGTGDDVSQVWDGKDGAGGMVPEGSYTYVFEAVEPESGVPAAPRTGPVDVNLSMPVAAITAPAAGATVFDTVLVTGKATDSSGFHSYTLEYGFGEAPTSWTPIVFSWNPVENGTLASWVTNSFRDEVLQEGNGTYTLRLTVRDVGDNVATDAVTITLDNLLITDVSRAPDAIRAGSGETTTIGFTINQPAEVVVKLVPETAPLREYPDQTPDAAVKQFALGLLPAGAHTVTWDGTNDAGAVLPENAFIYVVEARAPSGRFDRFNRHQPLLAPPPLNTPAEHDIPSGLVCDGYRNRFLSLDFAFRAPGRASLLIMASRGPSMSMHVPVDYELFPAGTATLFWDCRDEQGAFLTNLTQIQYQLIRQLNPYAKTLHGLKANYVLVLGGRPRVPGVSIQSDPYLVVASFGQVTRLKYTLEDEARVTVTVTDPRTGFATTLVSGVAQSAGDHEVTWDGTDGNGTFLSEGHATFTVTATNPLTGASTTRRGNITVQQ
jgi:flagellar hook assembly protein FlgD